MYVYKCIYTFIYDSKQLTIFFKTKNHIQNITKCDNKLNEENTHNEIKKTPQI